MASNAFQSPGIERSTLGQAAARERLILMPESRKSSTLLADSEVHLILEMSIC